MHNVLEDLIPLRGVRSAERNPWHRWALDPCQRPDPAQRDTFALLGLLETQELVSGSLRWREVLTWLAGSASCLAAEEVSVTKRGEPALAARVNSLEREVSRLRQRVSELETLVPAAGSTHADPYMDWCERHHDELVRLGDRFVAISLSDGIVASFETDAEMERYLGELSEEVRANLLVAHTSSLA